MPILPIWWSGQPGMSVSVFLGGMAIQAAVSMVIDFPLSIWSDKTQPRIPYAAGLGLFAVAFIAALIGGFGGFVAYLILICLAGALMSGADTALLVDIAGHGFAAEIYELNRRFYLFTSSLFLVGVALYVISPGVVFAIQALLLLLACAVVCTLRPVTADRVIQSSQGSWVSQVTQDGQVGLGNNRPRRITPTAAWVVVVVAIAAASGEFEAANQLLNRSLQIVIAEVSIPGINELWTVAGVLVVTNLLSSVGLGGRARRLGETYGPRVTLAALAVGTLLSLLWVNSAHLLLITLGAVMMGVTKGVYRPFFATLSVQTMPSPRWKARWLSITGVLSGLVSSLVNVLIVVGGPTAPQIVDRMAIQLLCVLIPAILVIGVGLQRVVAPTEKSAAPAACPSGQK